MKPHYKYSVSTLFDGTVNCQAMGKFSDDFSRCVDFALVLKHPCVIKELNGDREWYINATTEDVRIHEGFFED